MSTFKVPLTRITAIFPHPDPETTSLEIAQVYGFNVVVKKDQFKVNDRIVYFPIDTVLSALLEERIFPPGSKISLHNRRIRQIRIRKYPSQGMIVGINELPKEWLAVYKINTWEDESDLTEVLNVSKYEPPAPTYATPTYATQTTTGLRRNRAVDHKLFHSYNGLDALKWYPHMFDGEQVVVEEKTHGTNCRVSILPTQVDTFWKKILNKIGLLPKYEKNYGSNNVQISRKSTYKGFYGKDVYGEALKNVDAFNKIDRNEIVYGEVVGEGIQKGYHYGHKKPHFIVFDVKRYNEHDGTFTWLTPEEVTMYCHFRGFDRTPVLYMGLYDAELVKSLTVGPSVYCPAQKIREGVVIKSRTNYNDPRSHCQRKSLKLLSEEYLDKNNTEFH